MSQEFQSVEALIDGVKGTAGFFSNLISKKYGLTFVFIIAGVILSKIFLG